MGLANLALSGFPFLSGFYSKDMLLEVVYMLNSNILLLTILCLATMLTILYSLRLSYYCLWRGCLETPYINYQDSPVIMYPIVLMSFLVIFLGSSLGWIIFPEPIFYHLKFEVKSLNLLLVIFAMCAYLVEFNRFRFSGAIGNLSHYFGALWFLPFLTRGGITYILQNFKFYSLGVDQAWIEEIGAQGIFNFITDRTRILSANQTSGLRFLLKVLFFILLINLVI